MKSLYRIRKIISGMKDLEDYPKPSMYFQALERREIAKGYRKQEWFCYVMIIVSLLILLKGVSEI